MVHLVHQDSEAPWDHLETRVSRVFQDAMASQVTMDFRVLQATCWSFL